ncbi:DUF2683 family protein [Sinomicrobium soli]|uniref:DUF2683 family protein n=1 Tax=Sinomicrobium sp. N-1-3-6 TaxID=2219864 RepID=UPI000DCE3CB4|nr:DUF2683 family protein [Sinomicrobium sp. N-1-3-6]RAV27422.1 hypothetical protein DN748_18710 [Sinomicrobium sp. N-1-3-6]
MKPVNITAYTDDASQIEAIKAFMKALKIKFELTKEKSPYDPAFVEKVLDSKQQAENGQVTRVKKEDLKAFLKL